MGKNAKLSIITTILYIFVMILLVIEIITLKNENKKYQELITRIVKNHLIICKIQQKQVEKLKEIYEFLNK